MFITLVQKYAKCRCQSGSLIGQKEFAVSGSVKLGQQFIDIHMQHNVKLLSHHSCMSTQYLVMCNYHEYTH